MATLNACSPDALHEWIERRIQRADYANARDYAQDLVRRDRARREQKILAAQQRDAADQAAAACARPGDGIFGEANEIVRACGWG